MKHCLLFLTQSTAQGTVPYLGIFLTDLTMLDTAVKDRLDVSFSHVYQGESRSQPLRALQYFTFIKLTLHNLSLALQNGYINFDKRRRVSASFKVNTLSVIMMHLSDAAVFLF